MALPALLHWGNESAARNTFAFEHANAHRTLLGGMAPLDRFSALPYFTDQANPRGIWSLNHQQAHQDALTSLPTWPWTFWGVGGNPPVEPVPTPTGLSFGANLRDTNLTINPDAVPWWTFVNHQEHYLMQQVLPQYLTFPFW